LRKTEPIPSLPGDDLIY